MVAAETGEDDVPGLEDDPSNASDDEEDELASRMVNTLPSRSPNFGEMVMPALPPLAELLQAGIDEIKTLPTSRARPQPQFAPSVEGDALECCESPHSFFDFSEDESEGERTDAGESEDEGEWCARWERRSLVA